MKAEYEKLMKAYDKKQVNNLCELFSFGGVLMVLFIYFIFYNRCRQPLQMMMMNQTSPNLR